MLKLLTLVLVGIVALTNVSVDRMETWAFGHSDYLVALVVALVVLPLVARQFD
jgi:hypothetical protein